MSDGDSFDAIMDGIRAGLTGDPAQDVRYLRGKAEEYRDHPLGKEIVRECARMMYDALPDEAKAKISDAAAEDGRAMRATLDGVQDSMRKGDFEGALDAIGALAGRVEAADAFRDDSVSEYRSFAEPFEEMLYHDIYKPTHEVRTPSIPYGDIYFLYGNILVELKRLDEAREKLEKGLEWNPVSFALGIERAETFRMGGDMARFFDETVLLFRVAFRPHQVARLYRNLGYCFTERRLYDVATACYFVSMSFEKSPQAQRELLYIAQRNGGSLPSVEPADLEGFAKEHGFPTGPDTAVLGLAYSYGMHFIRTGRPAGARYCLTILYDLTGDETVRKVLDSIPRGE